MKKITLGVIAIMRQTTAIIVMTTMMRMLALAIVVGLVEVAADAL